MLYEYECRECGGLSSHDCPMGKAPKAIECGECDGKAVRSFGSMNFVLKGDGWPGRDQKIDRQETQKSIEAGKKTRDSHHSPKLVAQDHGNGDVRGV